MLKTKEINICLEEGTRIALAECEDGAINIYIHVLKEEGTRIAWTECEDGAIKIYTCVKGGRDPYCTGGVRRRCYKYIYMY